MAEIERIAAAAKADKALSSDFQKLCEFGGRQCGTASELAAFDWLHIRLEGIGGMISILGHAYDGWLVESGDLTLPDNPERHFDVWPLLRSPDTGVAGLVAPVVDLGAGNEADFARVSDDLAGAIALVRHSYMFAPDHVHRSRKYDWAQSAGAAGFLIAAPETGIGPVAGGLSFDHATIPAAGISAEAAAALSETGGQVTLRIAGRAEKAQARSLVLELPGAVPEWVVISAHLDGHGIGESALDNASGVAACLAVARTLAPMRAQFRRGLRLCLFSVEEWGLLASADYVGAMAPAEHDAIALNLNLDSVAGSLDLTALTSGFPALGPFLASAAQAAGIKIGIADILARNSDHYNFATCGIPACRLVAGFDDPDSRLRFVLTAGDVRGLAEPGELENAAGFTAAAAWAALTEPDLDLRAGSDGDAS